ncbi:MAG: DUF721 domain-containing protein [Phycisphaerales bacterium]|jgi:hypothetical protein|nr:DUF721 domain-containing protein [Phycisphaerales bacterium]
MPVHRPTRRLAELHRLQRFKQSAPTPTDKLGMEMVSFFKQSVQKRQTKLGVIAQHWSELVPGLLNDHCSLESLSRGTLTVLVDSASHLYELKQLLLAGLQQQLLIACRSSGLRKINLKPGRWYEGESTDRKLRFDR